VKSKTYTQSKWPLDKNRRSKFCQSSVRQTHFQNLKKKRKWFFLLQGHFKYLGVMLSSMFTWSDHVEFISCKINKNLGWSLHRIKYYLPYNARLLFYNRLVLPIFDYADLVWGDKDNVTLMKELQILQNKVAKLILDRPLHSWSTNALTVLRWMNLEERRKCHRCIYAYKCINGQLEHSLDIVRKSDMHSYNNRNKDALKLPKIKNNWENIVRCITVWKTLMS